MNKSSKDASEDIKPKSKLTKEEEILLQDFSRNVSTKSSALFYGNGFIITAIQAWIFLRIFPVEPVVPILLVSFLVLTIFATFLMAYAYKNVKFVLKHKFAQKREDAIAKEILNIYGHGNTATTPKEAQDEISSQPTTLASSILAKKLVSKKERDERILWKKNEVSDYEATTYSIFYNNALFLLCFLAISCFVCSGFKPLINYSASMLLGSGLTALFSTGSS